MHPSVFLDKLHHLLASQHLAPIVCDLIHETIDYEVTIALQAPATLDK